MKKKLPAHNIANELAGASAFFKPQDNRQAIQPPAEIAPPIASEPEESLTRNQGTTKDSAPNHATTVASNQDTKQPLPHDKQKEVAALSEIRKAVKQLGKEAATYRFRAEEKTAIADIVYTYTRQGIRTSENEITRIAVNWLLLDYHQNGANSVLARLLEELHG